MTRLGARADNFRFEEKMSVSKLITLERVNGSGMVLAGDKEIARALYILRVNQTMIRSGQDDLPGEISISGHLLI